MLEPEIEIIAAWNVPWEVQVGAGRQGPWVPGIGSIGPLPAGCQSPEYWTEEGPEAWSLRSENLKLLRPLQAILQI